VEVILKGACFANGQQNVGRYGVQILTEAFSFTAGQEFISSHRQTNLDDK
jgi:hypothetical protein